MSDVFLHNPRCSKSRAALEIVREADVGLFAWYFSKGFSTQRHKGHEEIPLCSLCLCGD